MGSSCHAIDSRIPGFWLLHISHPDLSRPEKKIDKIRLLLNLLLAKFQGYFYPCQNLSADAATSSTNSAASRFTLLGKGPPNRFYSTLVQTLTEQQTHYTGTIMKNSFLMPSDYHLPWATTIPCNSVASDSWSLLGEESSDHDQLGMLSWNKRCRTKRERLCRSQLRLTQSLNEWSGSQ